MCVAASIMGLFCILVQFVVLVDVYGNPKYDFNVTGLIWGVLWIIYG